MLYGLEKPGKFAICITSTEINPARGKRICSSTTSAEKTPGWNLHEIVCRNMFFKAELSPVILFNFSAVASHLLKVGTEYASSHYVQAYCRGPGLRVTARW